MIFECRARRLRDVKGGSDAAARAEDVERADGILDFGGTTGGVRGVLGVSRGRPLFKGDNGHRRAARCRRRRRSFFVAVVSSSSWLRHLANLRVSR